MPVSYTHLDVYKRQEKHLLEALDNAKIQWDEDAKNARYPISEEDIAEVVAMMTGIPVSKVAQTESAKLLTMGNELTEAVIGQNEAVATVSYTH